jgi:hypothetical protein
MVFGGSALGAVPCARALSLRVLPGQDADRGLGVRGGRAAVAAVGRRWRWRVEQLQSQVLRADSVLSFGRTLFVNICKVPLGFSKVLELGAIYSQPAQH